MMLAQGGSSYSQPEPEHRMTTYQQALYGITPIRIPEPCHWMFDGQPMSLSEFADRVFGSDEQAKTIFLLKYA